MKMAQVSVAIIVAILSGCAAQGATTKADTNEGTFARVFPVLSTASESVNILNRIRSRCGLAEKPGPEIAPLVGTILSALVGSGIKLGINAIDARLKKALEEYSKSYTGRYGGVFNRQLIMAKQRIVGG